MRERALLLSAVAAMATVVVVSNVLVLHPVEARLGGLNLADVLTWGAFTYPFAFLVTDVVNRAVGPALARRVAVCGFVVAVAMSAVLASPRVALASGTAFLAAQLFDVALFDRLRRGPWWRAPLASSLTASMLDTALFFAIAFSAAIPFGTDPFATAVAPLFGVDSLAAVPRWVSWALADFAVKIAVAAVALAPYRVLTLHLAPARRTAR